MARKLGIDGQAVAYAVLERLLAEDAIVPCFENLDCNGVADHLISAADVEFQPRTRKLVLTFDLAEPKEAPATEPFVDDEPVPYVPAQNDMPSEDVAL